MEKYKKQFVFHRLLHSLIMFMLFVCLTFTAAKNTEAATNGFREIQGKTYYYLNNVKQTGFITISGDTYYFNSKGEMVTGWTKDSKGQKRYFYPNGKMAVGWVKTANGKTRYFYSGSGVMATGWITNAKGQKRYFYSGTGYMATGWVKGSSNTIRYFNTKNGIMYTGLKTIGKNKYYFDTKTGARFQNGTKVINSKKYSFDKNGIATEVNVELTYVTTSSNVLINDPNGRKYPLVLEYLEHPGVADGTVSDQELLAALCECEAGNQGLIGMEAVALCILNRTIASTKEFPSTVRGVIYHGTSFPQYSVVRNGTLLKRLNGSWNNKELAMQAAAGAMKIFDNYVNNGTPRTLKGFPKKDFNYMYFMMESSFWKQNLNFDKVDYFLYVSPIQDTHMFFVDWVSP